MEALWTLLWTLGKIDTLGWPSGQSDAGKVGSVVPQLGDSIESFIEGAELRPLSEIMDQGDLMFRLIHALQETEGGLDGVEGLAAYEWYLALQWTCHGREWVEIAE